MSKCKLCNAKNVPITFLECCAGCNAIYNTEKLKKLLIKKGGKK